MLAPQIAVALFTSSGRMSQLRNAPAFKAEIIFASGGNSRLACSRLASKLRATSRLEYAASFAVVVGKGLIEVLLPY